MPTNVVYEHYFQIARAADDASNHLADGASVVTSALAGTGSMAGSDVAGQQWGTEYDAGVQAMLDGIQSTSAALVSFATRTKQAAYNWAEADGIAGAVPGEEHVDGVTPILMDASDPPSAVGDSGAGLQGVIDLVGEIGVPVPNGDTGDLASAQRAWNAFLAGGVASAIASLDGAVEIISIDQSPEVDLIEGEFDTLKAAVHEIDAGVRHLGNASGEFKKTLDDLRDNIKDAVEQMLIEQAAAAAVGIALSFVTAGIASAGAIGVAGWRITATARKIKNLINVAKGAAVVSTTGKKLGHGLTMMKSKIDEIAARLPKTLTGKADDLPKPVPKSVQDSIDYATNPAHLRHVVEKPGHNLDLLVEQFETPEDFIKEVVTKVKELPNLTPGTVYNAENPLKVVINGTEMEVRGFYDSNGIFKIGTAYIP